MDLSRAPGPRPFSEALERFALEVGADGAVAIEGGRTAWRVGGEPATGTRLVRAPAGIIEHDPSEMVVRVGAGAAVSELRDALAEHGQEVLLPVREGGTIGGALCVGWSDVRRLGRGPLRDTLLEASVVTAEGQLVRCGGPTVKNVTGYDLCRVLVGSLGTLALIGEVVLRTQPLRTATTWLAGPVAPVTSRGDGVVSACLWDRSTTWVLLEGHPDDVDAAAATLKARGMEPVEGPPVLPPYRWSVDPAGATDAVRDEPGRVIVEVGVGTVHADRAGPARPMGAAVRSLNQRMKQIFDPTGRLNPGRDVLDP